MDRLIPFRNRHGLFAVLTEQAAAKVTAGHLRLFFTPSGPIYENASRTRRPLTDLDDGVRVIFVATDLEGRLVFENGR